MPNEECKDEHIPLNEAGKFIPGRRPHRATLWRWSLKGICCNGEIVKLGTVAIGGRRFTTKARIAEFLRACNSDASQPVANESFQRRAEAAARVLESMGVRSLPQLK